MPLNKDQWDLTQEIIEIIDGNLRGNTRFKLPAAPRPPNPATADWDKLITYLGAISFERQLDQTVIIAWNDLKETGDAFAAAHRAAAAVEVPFPDEKTVERLQEDLGIIHKELQPDQRFSAVAGLAGALGEVIKKTA